MRNVRVLALLFLLGILLWHEWRLIRHLTERANSPLPKPPHILFILADDLGWNDVSYNGGVDISTPNIDRLAAEGVKLHNYYVQPICTPSRSQLLSGRYQIHTGLQHHIIQPLSPSCLPPKIPTLANKLSEAGYSTHIVGKWHLGFCKQACLPTNRGFSTFFGYLHGMSSYFEHTRLGIDDFRDERDDGESFSTEWCKGKYSTHLFTERAQNIARKHVNQHNEKPLFTYLAHQAVHGPHQVPDKYLSKLQHIKDTTRRTFAAMALAMDEGIGTITQTYKDLNLWDNTLVIFSTDNGGIPSEGGFNWPLRGQKHTLWEGGIRGVGFISGGLVEKRAGGSVNTELLHISDWFPTLLHLAGKETDDLALDGHNIWETISTESKSPREEILINIDPLTTGGGKPYPNSPFDTRVAAALRQGDYKIITGNPGRANWVHVHKEKSKVGKEPKEKNVWLFNIASDHKEEKDLSAAEPEKVMELLHRLAYYNSSAVPVQFPPQDPRAEEVAEKRGYWGPWLD